MNEPADWEKNFEVVLVSNSWKLLRWRGQGKTYFYHLCEWNGPPVIDGRCQSCREEAPKHMLQFLDILRGL